MSNSNPERLISDEKLDEQITLNEDRIESTIDLLEDCDSFVKTVLIERLSHYRWCLGELQKEKKKRVENMNSVTTNESKLNVEESKSGIVWDSEDLKGTGENGERFVNGEWYFTFEAAKSAAKKQGKRLPTKKEFDTIVESENIWDDTLNARKFGKLILPVNGMDLRDQGIVGYYWSCTEEGENAYILYFNFRFAGLTDNVSKNAHLTVRCIIEK